MTPKKMVSFCKTLLTLSSLSVIFALSSFKEFYVKNYTFTFRIGSVSQSFDYECESVSLYDAVNQFAAFASLYAKDKGSDVSYFRSHYSVSSARSLSQSRLLPQKHRSFLKFSFNL